MRKWIKPVMLRSMVLGSLLVFGGCSVKKVPPTHYYYLSQTTCKLPKTSSTDKRLGSMRLAFTLPSRVSESSSIYYIDENYKQQPYSYSRWYDTVDTMFEGKLLRAIESSGVVKSVAGSTTSANTDLVLEIGILDFVHDFSSGESSKGRVVLLASLVRSKDGKTVATRLFEAVATAKEQNAEGGVNAINEAADKVTAEIISWLKSL